MSWHRLVIKDAFRQLLGRVLSALAGFLVIKMMSPYLGPLRYGDYSTILKYFAIRSALADFWLYVIAVRTLWRLRESNPAKLAGEYGKFIGARFINIVVVYTFALVLAYLLPAYTSNPYLIRGLPIGMAFSATFMAAGIVQLPLQLFWKMEQLSIGLVLARMIQIGALAIIIYWLYPQMVFDWSPISKIAFLAIMGTVLLSAITQLLYVLRQAHKILPIKVQFSRPFIRNEIQSNRQYWLAYCFSSFHTLAVLILLSNYYPTVQGFVYTGIRALALALIEIFLIVPAALGNSLLHKIAAYNSEQKRRSFGHFLQLIRRIGTIIAINLFVRSGDIIRIVWGEDFLWTSRENPGANQILPFLGIVLALSFIKQVYNYLFVAQEKQNVLLSINIVWVIIGLAIGLWAIPHYGIIGGIITQLTLEVAFVLGSVWIAYKHNTLPYISRTKTIIVTIIAAIIAYLGYIYIYPYDHSFPTMLLYAGIANLIIMTLSYKYIRNLARWLTEQ